MEKLAGELAGVGEATSRYPFPYMEGRRRADSVQGCAL
jgi:predicted alpha/beta-hydrolase family hydrolase